MAAIIPEEKLSEIKNAVDIVAVVSEVVLLKKAGRNYTGLCPFHQEKTASFTVNPEKQIFHCFGCGLGGDVFKFVMKHQSLSFPEAVRSIAERYHIDLPAAKASPAERKQISTKAEIFRINKLSAGFFQKTLLESEAGRSAREYLRKRRIDDAVIGDFQLGFVPEGWNHLVRFLTREKIALPLAEKAGLVCAKKYGGYYDRFRNRIIFPIHGPDSRILGFGGRVMDDSLPKYLNSPETPVYNKSRTFYGMPQSRQMCRAENVVYIVEGYFDLLALYQAGIQNTVATLGTALTSSHLQVLKGYADKMVLVFDSDNAGLKAAQRSADLFLHQGINAYILVLPEGHDPDTYMAQYGAAAFKEAAEGALGLMPFLFETAVKKHGMSPEGKIKILQDVSDALMSIRDFVARTLYIKELSERIGLDEAVIGSKLNQLASQERKRFQSAARQGGATTQAETRRSMTGKSWRSKEHRLEERILAMMLHCPEMLPEIAGRKLLQYFEQPDLKTIGGILLENLPGRKLAEILALMPREEYQPVVTALAMDDDVWDEEGCRKLLHQFETSRGRRESALLDRIKAAEAENNQELLFELLSQKQELARKGYKS